jgi:hypothetical protein
MSDEAHFESERKTILQLMRNTNSSPPSALPRLLQFIRLPSNYNYQAIIDAHTKPYLYPSVIGFASSAAL